MKHDAYNTLDPEDVNTLFKTLATKWLAEANAELANMQPRMWKLKNEEFNDHKAHEWLVECLEENCFCDMLREAREERRDE